MKIMSVDIFGLKTPNPAWQPTVVRINTDEGISGYGEAGVAYGKARNGGFGQVKDFAEIIIGWDPMRIEAIWDNLYRNTFWGQGGGTVIFSAMSAIDIALWDIKGKALGVPVYELLGGKTNDNIRAYASQLQGGWSEQHQKLSEPKMLADSALAAVADGYDAVKVDPTGGPGVRDFGLITYDKLKLYREKIVAIREAVGPAVDIIVEMHQKVDVNSAIQYGRTIEDLNIFYIEEICTPLNPPLTKRVKEKLHIPIAGGERIYSRFGFRPFFEDRSLDVIQPDLCNCGGLSEGKKICDMADTYEIMVQLHICGGPIANAAALQLEAVIPNFQIHEHHTNALKEYNRRLCVHDYQPVGGKYQIPNLPGIGQVLSDTAMKEATLKCTVK